MESWSELAVGPVASCSAGDQRGSPGEWRPERAEEAPQCVGGWRGAVHRRGVPAQSQAQSTGGAGGPIAEFDKGTGGLTWGGLAKDRRPCLYHEVIGGHACITK